FDKRPRKMTMYRQDGWDSRRPVLVARRDFLSSLGCGLSAVALASLLERDARGQPPSDTDGRNRAAPHMRPRAKSVIWLFMRGGLSHLESFDPKPMLSRLSG